MGYMTYPGYYGYSTGNIFVLILMLLLKIFAFALFIAVAVGIFMWIRNNYFENGNQQKSLTETDEIHRDAPMLKTMAIVGAVILGIVLVFALFNRSNWYGMGYGLGVNPIYIITAILTLIVKTLIAVLVISLIMAAVTLIKEQYDSGKLNIAETENKKQL